METIIRLTKEDVNGQLLEIIKNMFTFIDKELVITIKTKRDSKHSIKQMTIEEYNKRLERSEEAEKNGNVYTHEQVLSQINQLKSK